MEEARYYAGERASPVNALRPAEAPLTLFLDSQLTENVNCAAEVRSRLYNLRDRLFGASPSAGAPSATRPDYNGFSDMVRAKGADLSSILSDIDSLTIDISNRL